MFRRPQELVKKFVQTNFPSCDMLDYALAVEDVTSSKKDTLILNVDGCIAVCFADLLRNSGAFSREEADEYMEIGTLNGLFVLGRTIGFIGHSCVTAYITVESVDRRLMGTWRNCTGLTSGG